MRALETKTREQDGNVAIGSLYACVRSPTSAARIEAELNCSRSDLVTIVQGDNGPAIEAADVVVLTCRPHDVSSCLGSDHVRKAMEGKVLVSGVAGVSISDLRRILEGDANGNLSSRDSPSNQTRVIRVMANLAAITQQSITVATMEGVPDDLDQARKIIEWVFAQVGTLRWVAPAQFDACVTLCSSGPAFMATYLEALVDGALAQGISRQQAVEMAALMAQGTASLILMGQSTADIRNSVTTPGGSTIQGIIEMEERGVRPMGIHTIGRATNRLTELASKQE